MRNRFFVSIFYFFSIALAADKIEDSEKYIPSQHYFINNSAVNKPTPGTKIVEFDDVKVNNLYVSENIDLIDSLNIASGDTIMDQATGGVAIVNDLTAFYGIEALDSSIIGNDTDISNKAMIVINVPSGTIDCTVGDGTLGTNTDFKVNGQDITTIASSLRYKTNISDLENYEDIFKLRPVKFEYKNALGQIQYGFIIEEMIKADIFKDAILNDKEGNPDGLKIHLLFVAAIKALQEMKQELDAIKLKLNM